jgi:hypothetical protein
MDSNRCLLGLASLLFSLSALYAQPDSLWTRTFDVGGHDEARALAASVDGGFLLAGYTTDPARADSGIGWLLKLDSAGDSLWFRELPALARINSMTILPDGGCAVCGRSEDFQGRVARVDAQGTVIWTQTRNAQAELTDVCLTQDGGIACCGYRWQDFGVRQDALVVKFSSNGGFLWQWQSSMSGWDRADGIVQATNGDLIIAGSSVRTPNTALLIRLSPNGVFMWTEPFAPQGHTLIRSTRLLADSAAGCVVGLTQEAGDGSAGFSLMRIASNRLPIWSVTQLESDIRSELRDLAPLTQGDLISCGMLEDTARSIFLERRHNADNPVWTAQFYAPEVQVRALLAVSDSDFVVTGSRYESTGECDIFVMRVGNSGPHMVEDLVIYRVLGLTQDVRLYWSASSGATAYNIYRSTVADFSPTPAALIGTTSATQFDDEGAINLAPPQRFYLVTAILNEAPAVHRKESDHADH